MSNDISESSESTFRSYTPALAKAYAAGRGSYHENLFNTIIDNHKSTGGSMQVLLDIGCGPGNSTRPLARHFDSAFGIDPSPEMINTARNLSAAPDTASGKSIIFSVGKAEEMDGPFRETGHGVDLLTSGTAAHWFDMPRFWSSAAACLKPGATVALWTKSFSYCHPATPNAAKVQEAIIRLNRENIAPYELPGNRLSRDSYDHLLLPWNCNPPVDGFLESEFTRLEWDRDGKLSDPDHFFLGDQVVTIDMMQKRLSTASMVTRWRESHPQQAGTEQDIVVKMAREMREVVGGEEWLFSNLEGEYRRSFINQGFLPLSYGTILGRVRGGPFRAEKMSLIQTVVESTIKRDFSPMVIVDSQREKQGMEVALAYILQQTFPTIQTLGLCDAKAPIYTIRLDTIGSFLKPQPHMLITQDGGVVAQVKFQIHSYDTSIIYNTGINQKLTLQNLQDQMFACSINGKPHWWHPLGPSKGVFELIEETKRRVAIFVYAEEQKIGEMHVMEDSLHEEEDDEYGKLDILSPIRHILDGVEVGKRVQASTQVDGLKRIDLPLRRTFAGSGEVNGPALLWSLQKTLNKYHSKRVIEASANVSLVQRLATENLIDQVEAPDFDEEYYGPMEVGSGTEQVFTVQFDTGSSDIFIPGPQCTNEQGCPFDRKYDQAGIFQDRTTVVQYGSGYIEGDDYTDSISVAGLTATDQGLISLTQASGFNTSDSDGLLGMGFTSIAASGFTTFFENLMIQQKVAAPEFSFYLGRAASGTANRGSLCLGCRDPSKYTGTFTQVPVTEAGYWQILLNTVTVNNIPAGPHTEGQAIIDTGTTLVLAPTAAAYAIFELIPNAFPIPSAGYSDQTFFAYPCATPSNYIPAIRFGGKSFGINPLDFNVGLLTSEFARLLGNESLAVGLEAEEEGDGVENKYENCVAAVVGTDVSPQENLYVVGDAFLKNWYTTFNYVNAGGGPSVGFAQAV
ncbi:MAG: hypothetical protein ASARMPREDX12_005429 [Alectoria sarmentosa]|nr:MAG: hypothetical protein ASARMPREDX12_005429 [Alectoria sarmentosa]